MIRLLVLVEGETEERFVNQVLAPHLHLKGFGDVSARLMGNARQRSRRGGIRPWQSAKRDISRHLRSDQGVTVALLVDYYGLPVSASTGWPGRSQATHMRVDQNALHVERSLKDAVDSDLGPGFDSRRFAPCIMLHEFEAMLFSDCRAFAVAIDREELEGSFQEIRDQFASPEHIDDSPETAPSKRIGSLMPEYSKPIDGIFAVSQIGLPRIRSECQHFSNWLSQLEALA